MKKATAPLASSSGLQQPQAMPPVQPLAVHALAQAQLREAGVRVTPARVNVMATLLGGRSALSHQDLQDRFGDMDRVTLYRALDCLTEAGLAHKIASDDRIFRYSAGAEHGEHGHADHGHGQPMQHQHGHFKCNVCARVFCLDDSFLENVLPAARDGATDARLLQRALETTLGPGFRSQEIELTIKGQCADCAR